MPNAEGNGGARIRKKDSIRCPDDGGLQPWCQEMQERIPDTVWHDLPPMFTKHPKPTGLVKDHGARIGVPGHQMYSYLNDQQIWLGILGSVWELIVKDLFFYGYVLLYAGSLFTAGYFRDHQAMVADWNSNNRIFTLCIFTVTFYVGNVFNRYATRIADLFKMNGSVGIVSGVACGWVQWDVDHAKALARYANAMVGINYLSLSGPMDAQKWGIIEHRGLLDEAEIRILKEGGGTEATVVFSWAINVVQTATDEMIITDDHGTYLIGHLGTIRCLSGRQAAYSSLQVPRPYFHLMWLANQTMLILTIMSTSLAFAKQLNGQGCGAVYEELYSGVCLGAAIWCAIEGLWYIILIFAIYKVSSYLSDPMGNGCSDYDLSVDMNNLWMDSLRLLAAGSRGLPPVLAGNSMHLQRHCSDVPENKDNAKYGF